MRAITKGISLVTRHCSASLRVRTSFVRLSPELDASILCSVSEDVYLAVSNQQIDTGKFAKAIITENRWNEQ